ncbi:MAG: hypothetical protein AAGM38_11980 [Pseudomonadota bacterium]
MFFRKSSKPGTPEDAAALKHAALALAAALIEDTEPFAPYAMARMTDYGKVAGYASAYAEVRRDVLDFLDLCDALALDGRQARALSAPPGLTQKRLFNEAVFEREKDALLVLLRGAAGAIEAAPAAMVAERYAALRGGYHKAFEELLDRSGLDAASPSGPAHGEAGIGAATRDEPAPKSREAPSVDPALETAAAEAFGAARGKIYVSSRYSTGLRDQIATVLADAGLDPVTPGGAQAAGSVDFSKLERDLRDCAGGVFGLLPPTHGAIEALSTAERGEGANPLAPGLAEIALAERRMGRKVMILAQKGLVSQLPPRLRQQQIFTLNDREMNARELSHFRSVAARTPWITH